MPRVTLEFHRTAQPSAGPVIVRSDGLRVKSLPSPGNRLRARIEGEMFGEVVIAAPQRVSLLVNGVSFASNRDDAAGTQTVPFFSGGNVDIEAF